MAEHQSNLFGRRMERMHSKIEEKDIPSVLDPDDSLMKKFQQTLAGHLTRVANKLSEQVLDLESSINKANQDLEVESTQLYYAQQEVVQQRANIKQYQDALSELTILKEKENRRVANAKEIHKNARFKLFEEKKRKDQLSSELQKATSLQSRFVDWEKELADYLAISKRISSRDAITRKELFENKQRKDYILCQLSEELMRLESEIVMLDEQLQIKDHEKRDVNRMIIDANTDLESLQKEQKQLRNAWNSVVMHIGKRDSIYDQVNLEREKIRKLLDEQIVAIERIKKDTEKEMETNECLTTRYNRTENNIKNIGKLIDTENDRFTYLELELIQIHKSKEQTQNDYNDVWGEYQNCLHNEDKLKKEAENLSSKKHQLEQAIFKKLENKVMCDKTAQYINRLLVSTKEMALEQEFLLAKAENAYGSSLLQLERLTNNLELQKSELHEILDRNNEKTKQMEDLTKQVKIHEATIERKQYKLININKTIEQILPNIGDKEFSPLDLKIVTLQKNIEETEQKIVNYRRNWMRQEGFMVTISQQRNHQLQELNMLNKEIMIMEQKNRKLDYLLEKLSKEEADADRQINLLEQKIQKMSSDMVARKDIKDELEGKTCIAKNECIMSFQDLQLNLIKLENDLKNMYNVKISLKEALEEARQKSLSWERKVQLTQETVKKLKEESESGEIGLMKSEIHKMEMRQSQLKRIQEKLIHDMEFCVTRRDIIVDKAINKLTQNPKEQHNRRVILQKRLADYKSKIKQHCKSTKQLEEKLRELKNVSKDMREKVKQTQDSRKTFEEKIPTIDEKIYRHELIKCQNLQNLVWKQRKTKLLRDIKSGRYRMLIKNESSIEGDLQSERTHRIYLKEIMEKTKQDFPLLKNPLLKILMQLQTNLPL